jgi:hypothetical protein
MHHLGSVAFTMHYGLVGTTFQPASSIDSLVRVSRRAESGTAAPSSTAHWHMHCLGHQEPPRTTIRRVQTQRAISANQGQAWPLACP